MMIDVDLLPDEISSILLTLLSRVAALLLGRKFTSGGAPRSESEIVGEKCGKSSPRG